MLDRRTRVTLNERDIELIGDALAYYHLFGMGGQQRATSLDLVRMRHAQDVIDRARQRIEAKPRGVEGVTP
jgi:hypothetical protein